jgi:hypothetical protein
LERLDGPIGQHRRDALDELLVVDSVASYAVAVGDEATQFASVLWVTKPLSDTCVSLG